ncbi:MAG: RluA family pseudouridine synthase [Myxococcales bacterium]|nr:RluA family pseudouridine synthase [Myxococcales bacterium]
MVELVAGSRAADERADKLVVALLAAAGHPATRTEVQRWMREGRVTSGGRALDRTSRLAAGARIAVRTGAQLTTAARPDPTIALAVVYEDPWLVVVDKPAGLVVHPARGHREGTLVNGLLAHGGFEAGLADPLDPEGHLRPGIVHRLDKDTSGLVVVAKQAQAREGLKALFQRHDIVRSYLAIVAGRATAARYDTPHGRDPRDRLRFTTRLPRPRPGAAAPRRAVTEVEVLETFAGACLVRCRLETGRTHQIRVHLAERGHTPVLADAVYGAEAPASPEVVAIARALGRQALHAAELGFVHPVTGVRLHFAAPLPADMERALAALRALG